MHFTRGHSHRGLLLCLESQLALLAELKARCYYDLPLKVELKL